MPQEITQEGTFRGRIIQYGLQEAKSGAIGVWIRVAVDEVCQDGEWGDWREYEVEADGYVWIVKKDGNLNKPACESLIKNAGWNGDIKVIDRMEWEPTPVGISVKANEYDGKTTYQIAFVNDYNRIPGGGNVAPEKVDQFAKKFNSQLRALAGSSKQNAAPPANGGPSKPAAPAKTAEPAASSSNDDDQDCPF